MKKPHILTSACPKTTKFRVFDNKTSKTRLLRFLKPRSLLIVNDCFKNENNAVFGVFLQRLTILLGLISILITTSCRKDDEEPTTGFIDGIVSDFESAVPLPDVRIIVFNANTNSPTGETVYTNAEGYFKIETEPGTYYLKLFKLGYESIPRPGISAIPITVVIGETFTNDFELSPSSVQDGGIISGKVSFNGEAKSGVMVIAENEKGAYSSVSDTEGNYYIYNVPAGSYTVTGFHHGYNSISVDTLLGIAMEISEINIVLLNDANVTVQGTITFLATENAEVDVALVHSKTKETIPGLTTMTINGSYNITNVPKGIYIGRASYENDKVVMDPDWIVKNGGEPIITVENTDIELNFSVTGAVKLLSPTNDSTSTLPVNVGPGTLEFTWEAYPSASDYIIEITDANGNIIWGGFSSDWSEKNIVIPSSQTSIAYNSDGNASSELKVGRLYRWRIFASKNDKQSATGWRLISVSEDQMGLIKIVE